MSLVELHDLVKSYGSVKALNKLSLRVPEGSLFGLLGPNGSGKSTTLRILCTLLAPDSGNAIVAGVDVLKNPRYIRQNIGYVAQEIAIDKILSGRELLQLHGDLYHLSRNDRDLRIEELVRQLEMGEWVDRRLGSYSGGMKRRLDLASGLLHQPKLLILDEPTVGLDIESRSTIWNLLRDLREKGTTILLSSHYLEEVDALADQMAIIDKGQVIGYGSPQELKDKLGGNRITLKVREFSDERESEKIKQLVKEIEGVGKVVVNRAQGFSLNLVVDDQDVLQKLRAKLTESGFDVFALSESRPSLDDVYLQATGRTIADVELEVAGKRDIKGEAKKSMR
ncbi:daunorubicin resistance protein DrrA family ABC transporter ATP-binding protein [Prochlorococcus marinus]|uniref:Putative multidrug efflux ABC transporter n=1 Tax=Prochlorococcus marinus (strain MIT 9211) TaxID=93059 RepID=A9BE68_PROM4|nr:daunorubicin resistance protein DrrA family ABC transporter ATP-binding protein [Prochlorococcus marinus]ABX08378.1 putative multidrug efflux ABC transporter [Prochlorococcus marinus str. MIT 9211]